MIKHSLFKKLLVADQSRSRLDLFLSKKLKINRSKIKKMINNKQIIINDKQPKKAGDRIKVGDEIVVCNRERSETRRGNPVTQKQTDDSDIAMSLHQLADAPRDDIMIIVEKKDYLIINKPAGLLTHPISLKFQASQASKALSQLLVKQYTEIKKVGDDPKLRPGIVHRLDKDASGLMIIARTQKMFNNLKQQFKNKTIIKEYLVLVHGQVEADEGQINFPITHAKNSERMAALPAVAANLRDFDKKSRGGHRYKNSREALTEFWVEKKFINFTLLRVRIHTGRTHQIRVHMIAYNHPVVGDELYYQKKQKRTWDKKCGRLFLHCVQLGFMDLENKKRIFSVGLPKQLNDFLNTLK